MNQYRYTYIVFILYFTLHKNKDRHPTYLPYWGSIYLEYSQNNQSADVGFAHCTLAKMDIRLWGETSALKLCGF